MSFLKILKAVLKQAKIESTESVNGESSYLKCSGSTPTGALGFAICIQHVHSADVEEEFSVVIFTAKHLLAVNPKHTNFDTFLERGKALCLRVSEALGLILTIEAENGSIDLSMVATHNVCGEFSESECQGNVSAFLAACDQFVTVAQAIGLVSGEPVNACSKASSS